MEFLPSNPDSKNPDCSLTIEQGETTEGENMGIYSLEKEQKKFYEEFRKIGIENTERMVLGAEDFIRSIQEKANRAKAVVGLSGGIDSALTATLAVRALGRENVIAVKMPYRGITSKESAACADLVADYLGLFPENIMEVPIDKAVNAVIAEIDKAGIKLDGLRIGNVMARQRMNILYAVAGTRNGLVADTCNKTEVLLGYFTRYGDGASDYNPVGGFYKTWVWDMARYRVIPKKIIDRKPTAELAIGQNDENDLGISYSAVDLLLWLLYDQKVPKEDAAETYYYPREIIEMVTKRVEANRFKSELPPSCEIVF